MNDVCVYVAKYGTPNYRLETIFSNVPDARRLGLLHYMMTTTQTMTAEEVESRLRSSASRLWRHWDLPLRHHWEFPRLQSQYLDRVIATELLMQGVFVSPCKTYKSLQNCTSSYLDLIITDMTSPPGSAV